jgi:hypothetical protein
MRHLPPNDGRNGSRAGHGPAARPVRAAWYISKLIARVRGRKVVEEALRYGRIETQEHGHNG